MELQISRKFSHSGHYKHALTQSAFGFSSSLAGSFFSAFSGACKTQIAHLGASDIYSDEKLQQKKSKNCANCSGLLPHMTRTTHAKHQNQNLYFRERGRGMFSIETQAQNHLQPTAKKASSHSLFSFAILAITNML